MSFVPDVVVAWNEQDPCPGALLKLFQTIQGYPVIVGDIAGDQPLPQRLGEAWLRAVY